MCTIYAVDGMYVGVVQCEGDGLKKQEIPYWEAKDTCAISLTAHNNMLKTRALLGKLSSYVDFFFSLQCVYNKDGLRP